MVKTLFLVLATIVSVGYGFAQEKETPVVVSEADSNACELNSAYFDWVSNDVRKTQERIFVIFRAGKNETETVNVKRFSYVKNFLENGKSWKVLDVIYARGEKTDGEGKIEFYVAGKLKLIVNSPRNKTPCLDCCENELNNPQNLVKKKSKRKY
jgi:hypothetical protein